MVIHDFHVVGIPIAPDKADATLIVDANVVLPFAVSVESFKTVPRRRRQVAEFSGNIQLAEFPLRPPLESPEPF